MEKFDGITEIEDISKMINWNVVINRYYDITIGGKCWLIDFKWQLKGIIIRFFRLEVLIQSKVNLYRNV